MGKFWNKILPKNTIAGKLVRGDKGGALSSAKNYVKSGEFLTDFKNVSTGNFVAMGKKAIGGSVGSLLNKQPTETLKMENLSGGISQASQAGATGSIFDSAPISSSSSTTDSNNAPQTPNLLLVAGAALVLFLMMKK
jgi:hypothetical protein